MVAPMVVAATMNGKRFLPKILVLLPVLFYVLTMTLRFTDAGKQIARATTAAYNMTIRIVDGNLAVDNFTASATTANYNATVRVVDQNGTVLNPGTASTVVATPSLTVRVVDASGFVQSNLGGTPAPTASPTPTPGAVATGTSNLSDSVTITGTTASDVIYCHVCTNNGTTINANAAWTMLPGSGAFGGGPPFHYVVTHVVVPGDTSSYTPITGATTFESMACVELAHAYPQIDTQSDWSTAKDTTNSTTVLTNNATSTLTNDIGLWLVLMQGNTSDISAAPSGYTTLAHIAGTATYQGCGIAFNPNVGAAGTVTTGNATGTNGATTVSTQTALTSTYKTSY